MKCRQVEELFSNLVEGGLSSLRETDVREHLEHCKSCSAALSGFESALGALRGMSRPSTSSGVRAAILDAVDAAATEANDPREEVFQRAVLLARGNKVAGDKRAAWVSHSAALLLGAAAAITLFLLFQRSEPDREQRSNQIAKLSEDSPKMPSTEPARLSMRWMGDPPNISRSGTEQATRARLDPDGRLRLSAGDVLTSDALRIALDELGALSIVARSPEPGIVDREVIKTVVERVEVPTMVEVERVVRRGPWLVVDTEPFVRALDNFAAALESSRVREPELVAVTHEELAGFQSLFETQRPATASEGQESITAGSGPSVRVRREGGLVSLETRGTLTELVPVLLAQLDTEEEQVVALIERRLEDIRQRAHADPELVQRLIEPKEQQASRTLLQEWFDPRPARTETPWGEGWTAWWRANGDLLAAAESSGDF